MCLLHGIQPLWTLHLATRIQIVRLLYISVFVSVQTRAKLKIDGCLFSAFRMAVVGGGVITIRWETSSCACFCVLDFCASSFSRCAFPTYESALPIISKQPVLNYSLVLCFVCRVAVTTFVLLASYVHFVFPVSKKKKIFLAPGLTPPPFLHVAALYVCFFPFPYLWFASSFIVQNMGYIRVSELLYII